MREHAHLPDVADAARALGSSDPAALLDAWGEAAAIVAREWNATHSIADMLQRWGASAAELEMIWRVGLD